MNEDIEMLYRYCMKRGIIFTYTESEELKTIIFSGKFNDYMIFSVGWDKKAKSLLYCQVDDKKYSNVNEALSDFDDLDLLAMKA